VFSTDQAAGLRRLFGREQLQVIVLGGAGAAKVSVAVNLAVALTEQGRRVMLMDGGVGALASALGLSSRYELAHVIAGDKRLADVLLAGPKRIHVLPAARALEQLDALSPEEASRLRHEFLRLRHPIDTLIVNARPLGAGKAVDAFQGRAKVLMVVSEGAASVTGAYREIKALSLANGMREFDVVIGAIDNAQGAAAVYTNIAEAAQRFLSVKLNFRGFIPCDATFRIAQKVKQPVSVLNAGSASASAFKTIASEMKQWLTQKGAAMPNKEINHATAC
jgi:flagellar biosynthesis protein FlhG